MGSIAAEPYRRSGRNLSGPELSDPPGGCAMNQASGRYSVDVLFVARRVGA
ncbi:hypothetical protein GCM10012279_37290 [Micromonospora yangpuensis]|nr:hypothetical protein GCM10012279_37290 [Micromonospora yangpuensis]